MSRETIWLKRTWTGFTVALLLLAAWAVVHPMPLHGQPSDDWRVHPRWDRRDNPEPMDAASVQAGARVWENECATCHGSGGRGDGPRAGDLRTRPGDFTDPRMWTQSDGAFAYKTLEGRDPMPGFRGDLSEQEVWQVVNYMRTLAPHPPTDTMPAEVRDEISELLKAYFEVATGLAESELESGDAEPVDALARAAKRLDELEIEDLDFDLRQKWGDVVTQLRQVSDELQRSTDLSELRVAFAALSDTLAEGVKSFGHAHGEPVTRYGCPEALDGEPASWLAAAGQEPQNPYLGDEHRDCVQQLQTLLGTEPE